MSDKEKKVNRRDFVVTASYAVGAVGVARLWLVVVVPSRGVFVVGCVLLCVGCVAVACRPCVSRASVVRRPGAGCRVGVVLVLANNSECARGADAWYPSTFLSVAV